MKTSVEINPEKLKKALELLKTKSIKKVLDRSLDALIAQTHRESMASMLETSFFDGELDKMRQRLDRLDR